MVGVSRHRRQEAPWLSQRPRHQTLEIIGAIRVAALALANARAGIVAWAINALDITVSKQIQPAQDGRLVQTARRTWPPMAGVANVVEPLRESDPTVNMPVKRMDSGKNVSVEYVYQTVDHKAPLHPVPSNARLT